MNKFELQHILNSFSEMNLYKENHKAIKRIENRILSFFYFYSFDLMLLNMIGTYLDENEVAWVRKKYLEHNSN